MKNYNLDKKVFYLENILSLEYDDKEIEKLNLKILSEIKHDIKKKKYFVQEERKYYEQERNYSEIKQMKKLDQIEEEIRFGEKSSKVQKLVLNLFKSFAFLKQIDQHLFDFAIEYYKQNMVFFELNTMILCFKYYAELTYHVLLIMSFMAEEKSKVKNEREMENLLEISDKQYQLNLEKINNLNKELCAQFFQIIEFRKNELTIEQRIYLLESVKKIEYHDPESKEFLQKFFSETLELIKKNMGNTQKSKGK